MLVYNDPGPTVMTSALRIAIKASGRGSQCSGTNRKRRILERAPVICVSPRISRPSSNSAANLTSLTVAGKMCPLLAKTSDDRRTASTKSPVTSVRAARKRFPRLWPPRSPDPRNRYLNKRASKVESSDNAIMQLRMSPGGNICSSSRNLPELPPSSLTVTIADSESMSGGSSTCGPTNRFRPARSVDKPVPPPIETTLRLPSVLCK